jgi:uncharacterized RDD family membrane protein YckC
VTRAEDRRAAPGSGAPAARYPWHEGSAAEPSRERHGLQGRRAGPVTRVLANLLDLAVVVLVLAVGYVVVAGFRFLWRPADFAFPRPEFELVLLVGAVVWVAYFTVLWGLTGRTYGDSVFGVRVVNARGKRLRLPGAALRALLCVVFPLGLLWVVVSPQNRSVQDVLLRTSVVYDWTAVR